MGITWRSSIALVLLVVVALPVVALARNQGEKIERQPTVSMVKNSQTLDLLEGFQNTNPTGFGASEVAIVDNTALNAENIGDGTAFVDLGKSGTGQISVYVVREGDTLSEQIFQEFGEYLGLAMANIVNLLDPGVIILGGGVMASADLFLPFAKKTMLEYVTSPEARKVKILQARLGDNAGAMGAALLFDHESPQPANRD